ncbi:MAG TPA: hypothetical protein VMW17_18760 [Candidatus Binatia bacterium]|nr:hypothetical protein [Candidatus Binatia bacterium]
MNLRTCLMPMWLVVALAACSGSGSSGFDAGPASERAAIQQALAEQRCVARGTLTICPADTEPTPAATPTPTATPTNLPLTTATVPSESPTTLPTATPTIGAFRSPTAFATAARTATPMLTPTGKHIDTNIDNSTPIACAQTTASTPCAFTFAFFPSGFPSNAVYRVAVRTTATGAWTVSSDVAPSGPLGASDFETTVAVPASASQVAQNETVQLAVLVFERSVPSVSSTVRELADTGADFAFVTPVLTLQPSS